MRIERLRRVLIESVFVLLAGFGMGTLVSVANFADYGPFVSLDVGTTIILSALATGIALGLRFRDVEPQYLVIAGFIASSFAVAIVLLTVFAPIVAGVVPGLQVLGSSDTARLAILFTSLFLIPIHVVGCVIGYAMADFLAPADFERGKELDRT